MNRLLDLLYPPRCILCHGFLESGQAPVCENCSRALLALQYRQRPVRPLERCISLLPYEGTYRESIIRYKFDGRRFYAKEYAKWLAALIREEMENEFDAMTWVPVSRERKHRRGYDQVELLCRLTGEHLGAETEQFLRKTRDNPAQSTMQNVRERQENVKEAFSAVQPEKIRDRRILLIDDVLTTGATIQICAKALLDAGAEKVIGCTLASV